MDKDKEVVSDEQILKDVLEMIKLLEEDKVYGPYGLWDGTKWRWVDKDLKSWDPNKK